MDFRRASARIRAAFHGEKLASLRVALTGTNSRPLLLEGTEALHGVPVDEANLTGLGKSAAANR
jgi:CO/xanthine dehydrogenase FAD-binding subunit